MAAVPVVISGLQYVGKANKPTPVTIVAFVGRTDVQVGGGPAEPPPKPDLPPGVPIHPIWGPPGFNPPGPGMPPGIWGDPIIPPPPPPFPNPPVEAVKPPPAEGGWGYHSDWGWFYAPGSGQPGPK